MTIPLQTYGRYPTLGEMKAYYQRPDIVDFFWQECQLRNVFMALDARSWEIQPQSRDHLRRLIDEAIDQRIVARNRKRAAKEGVPVEQLRLKLYEYLSFHTAEVLRQGEKALGFDMIFEPDLVGWRRSFEELTAVIALLDEFEICYRIKYSGVRSLHLIIPHEALPRQFMGKEVRFQREVLMKRLQRYFNRLCGLKSVDKPGFLRLAYSLNEDNGLVSLPLDPAQLADFRPWQANIHQVAVERPWHGQVSSGAARRTLPLLRLVFDRTQEPPAKGYSFGLPIRPRPLVETKGNWRGDLDSNELSIRLRAAWHMVRAGQALEPRYLADEHDDMRWYATESLQARSDDGAMQQAAGMMLDRDPLVRISAGDALILAGQQEQRRERVLVLLVGVLEREALSTDGLLDLLYVLYKLCQDMNRADAVPRVGQTAAVIVQRGVASGENANWDVWAGQMQAQCQRYGFDEMAMLGPTLTLCLEQLAGREEGVHSRHYVEILRKLFGYEVASQAVLEEAARLLQEGIAEADRDGENGLVGLIRQTLRHCDYTALCRVLLALLRDAHLAVRQRAGQILRLHPGLEQIAAEHLAQGLRQDDPPSRANAARALGELASVNGVEALVGALGDGDKEVRHRIVEAVGAIGPKAVAALLQLLREGTSAQVSNAALALGAIGDSTAVPQLVGLLGDKAASFSAARALGGIGGAAALAGLVEALAGSDRGARAGAVKALRQMGQVEAAPALVRALQDPVTGVRTEAAQALGELGPAAEAAIPALVQVWGDEHKAVREAAIQAVGKIGGLDSLPTLETALADGQTRRYAVNAMGRLQSPRAVPALVRLLEQDRSNEQVSIMNALVEIGQYTPAVEQAIKTALTDESNWVRGEAARSLRKLDRGQRV
ncbi:MAG: hypothetical protein GKR89_01305 [Candidatus Latescibacteria bacterium]|nr:hypothetical protein [Candidatus Latescibacterota bacterium]